MKTRTRYVHSPRQIENPYDPTSVPIFQTATFGQSEATAFDEFDYSRSGNPTRQVLEQQLARLENAQHAFAFASGMAALSALLRLCKAGDEILVGDEIYGGTFRLLHDLAPRLGLKARTVDTTRSACVAKAIRPETKLLLLETPSNPTLRISDLEALSSIKKARGVTLAVDNTMLSPYLQNPLDHGVDVVVHSATKHLNGHGDVMAGVVMTSDDDIAQAIGFVQNAEGSALGPFDSWLLLRGLSTLPIRLEAQQRNAKVIADWLVQRYSMGDVYFPTLADHPGWEIQVRQARGGGCVISFRAGSYERAQRIVQDTRLFRTSVSFGCFSSSISIPNCMSHACVHEDALFSTKAIPDDLVRLSVGIEDVEDLIEDLDLALGQPVQNEKEGVGSLLTKGATIDG
ncbi:MAG: PLP-dependent transferase [Planctomycetota bacterium]|nr:PLP-dependent transferase [Planctomycetota bacterium]